MVFWNVYEQSGLSIEVLSAKVYFSVRKISGIPLPVVVSSSTSFQYGIATPGTWD